MDGDYLYRFGFLPSEKNDRMNPDGLPIGFAMQDDFIDPTAPAKGPIKVVGLTCAACHTGEIHYRDATANVLKAVRIEGGAAMINLSLFQKAVGLALFYTNFFDARYNRFADSVLGDKKNDRTSETSSGPRSRHSWTPTCRPRLTPRRRASIRWTLGFARTDALGLIGNRVFGPLDRGEPDRHRRPGELPPPLGHRLVRLGPVQRLDPDADGPEHRRGPGRRGRW